jgi:hypothetical protein
VVTPFSEENISSNEVIRTFLPSLNQEDLKWHWDDEDREIVFISVNDWKYQIDNDLPRPCDGSVFIKAGTWHRVIKGKSELRVKITKYQNSEDI